MWVVCTRESCRCYAPSEEQARSSHPQGLLPAVTWEVSSSAPATSSCGMKRHKGQPLASEESKVPSSQLFSMTPLLAGSLTPMEGDFSQRIFPQRSSALEPVSTLCPASATSSPWSCRAWHPRTITCVLDDSHPLVPFPKFFLNLSSTGGADHRAGHPTRKCSAELP